MTQPITIQSIIEHCARSPKLSSDARRICRGSELWEDLRSEALVVLMELSSNNPQFVFEKHAEGKLLAYLGGTMHRMFWSSSSGFSSKYRSREAFIEDTYPDLGEEVDFEAELAPPPADDAPLIHPLSAFLYAEKNFSGIRLTDEVLLISRILDDEERRMKSSGRYPLAVEWINLYVAHGSYRKVAAYLDGRVSHVSIQKRLVEMQQAIKARIPHAMAKATDKHAGIANSLNLVRAGVQPAAPMFYLCGERPVPAFTISDLSPCIPRRAFHPQQWGGMWYFSPQQLLWQVPPSDTLPNLCADALGFFVQNDIVPLGKTNEVLNERLSRIVFCNNNTGDDQNSCGRKTRQRRPEILPASYAAPWPDAAPQLQIPY